MKLDFLRGLVEPERTKIILVVLDGLGGLPSESGGQTELETAHTPHLDALAARGLCGLQQPVGPGIVRTCPVSNVFRARAPIPASMLDYNPPTDSDLSRWRFCTCHSLYDAVTRKGVISWLWT